MGVYCGLIADSSLLHRDKVTLPALQRNYVNIFVVYVWGFGPFGIEKGQGFLVIFLWSPFAGKQSWA